MTEDETIHCGEIGCGEEWEVSAEQFQTGLAITRKMTMNVHMEHGQRLGDTRTVIAFTGSDSHGR